MTEDAWIGLAAAIRRNSYVRTPNTARRKAERTKYKKGWEVRFVLSSEEELAQLRELLNAASIPPAQPFVKRKQWIQPVYGKDMVSRLLESAAGR